MTGRSSFRSGLILTPNDGPGRPWWIVAALLAVHAGLLGYSGWVHSPTLNEPAHLVAGISHWKFGRFEVYRVNPPLVRMIAALPVLAAGAKTDWKGFYEGPGARPAFVINEDFVAANGGRICWLVTLARWACIPLSLVGGVVCFLWGRDLYGRGAGLTALVLWCFSPNVLAHGALITADMGATALGLAAGYLFWQWLKEPSWSRALGAGLGLGLAELTKTTWIVLFPLWPALWLLWYVSQRARRAERARWSRQMGQLAVILALALYVLNLGYGFEGSMTRLRDYQFVSRALAGGGSVKGNARHAHHGPGNRFTGTWLGAVPVPLPKNYVLGIDIQRRDFEDFGRPSYLRGVFREHGWWYYYLYAMAIKMPLGTWLLVLGAAVLRIVRPPPTTRWSDDVVLLAPAAVVLLLVSSQTGFNHHMRYVLPAFPYLFIWASQVAPAAVAKRGATSGTALSENFGARIASLFCVQSSSFRLHPLSFVFAVALLWSVASSLWVYPHSLSYFNELVGGPRGGHAHLINSNIDWGQDLLYLKRWLDRHPEARPLYIAYYGPLGPHYLGIDFRLPPTAEPHLPAPRLEPGWYAVSVNFLRGYPYHVYDEKGDRQWLPKGALSYFLRQEPVAMAGYSVYVYRASSSRRGS